MGELPRAYRKIQKLNRIAIPPELMKLLGWAVEDKILMEAYRGKLIVENLKHTIRPASERYK